ncbi:MAG: cytochrome P450 [Polyangiaceae bacterium]|nr:cytochrome P450 [Polyangiaceae bacterium]MBK8936192.1 cytochrome P450 [Polyangiaceae bacterium]
MVATSTLPRARGLPLVGSVAHYLRDQLGFLEQTSRLGDVVTMRFIRQNAYLVNAPALIEQVLVKQPSGFVKDVFLRELKRVLGEGLLTSEGDFWKRQRRLIQPAFHRDRIAGYAKIMVDHTARRVATWRDGDVLDLHHEMMVLTADIVTHALFGSDPGDTAEVAWCVEKLMERFADPLYLLVPAIDRLPLPANRRMKEVAARLDKIVRGFIAKRRALGAEGPDDDLLAMLLAAQDEDGGRMTDQQVRDELLVLFLAGHETTALALSWTFHLLGSSPAVRTDLADELEQVLAGREPSLDDLPKLVVCERIIQESLRLYPPAWALGREAKEPIVIGDVTFEKGAWLWLVPWTLHRDPRWFPDPLAFRPERWADGLAKRLPKGAYLPFGAGPRVCIGNQFAMMESVLLLATIAQRFELEAVAGQRVIPEPSITLRFKHGLRMRARRRIPLA